MTKPELPRRAAKRIVIKVALLRGCPRGPGSRRGHATWAAQHRHHMLANQSVPGSGTRVAEWMTAEEADGGGGPTGPYPERSPAGAGKIGPQHRHEPLASSGYGSHD
jgi:hypothetical protein